MSSTAALWIVGYLLAWVAATAIIEFDRTRHRGDPDVLPAAFSGAVWPMWLVALTMLAIGWSVGWVARRLARVVASTATDEQTDDEQQRDLLPKGDGDG